MHLEFWHQNELFLTLVLVGLVLGQILQQGFGYGERAAGCHLLDCVDPWEQKGLSVKSLTLNRFAMICALFFFRKSVAASYPTVITSPEFLSVTKLLAMVMMTGSMICRRKTNDHGYIGKVFAPYILWSCWDVTSGGTSWWDDWAAHSRIFVTSLKSSNGFSFISRGKTGFHWPSSYFLPRWWGCRNRWRKG